MTYRTDNTTPPPSPQKILRSITFLNSLQLVDATRAHFSKLWAENQRKMAPEIREFRAKTFSIRRMIFPEMAPKQYFFGVSFLDYWHRLKFATLLYVFSHACFHPYSGGGGRIRFRSIFLFGSKSNRYIWGENSYFCFLAKPFV